MKVFISYASANRTLMKNALLPHLEAKHVAYWSDEQIENGASLTEELRQAIDQSAACVFVATNESLDSDWCLMEVAAFWAKGKRVMIFSPDGKLDKTLLPEYLRHLSFNGEGSEIAAIAKKEIEGFKPNPTAKVADLPVLELEEMIRRAAGLGEVLEVMKRSDAVLLMARGLLDLARQDDSPILERGDSGVVRLRTVHKAVSLTIGQLDNLVGLPRALLLQGTTELFPVSFSFEREDESWTGFALSMYQDMVVGALTFGWDDDGRCDSVALIPRVYVDVGHLTISPDIHVYVGKRSPKGTYTAAWSANSAG